MNLVRQITVPKRCVDCLEYTQNDFLKEYDVGVFCKQCWVNFVKEYVTYLTRDNVTNERKSFEVFLRKKYGKAERMYMDEEKFQQKLYRMVSDYLLVRL